MVDNSKVEMVFDLLNSLEYGEGSDTQREIIENKMKTLIKDFIREKKQEKGIKPTKMDDNDYLDFSKMLKGKSVMKNFKSCKSFTDYLNS